MPAFLQRESESGISTNEKARFQRPALLLAHTRCTSLFSSLLSFKVNAIEGKNLDHVCSQNLLTSCSYRVWSHWKI